MPKRSSTGEDRERGVFMISVAAKLADMHPQTLRLYESRGLIQPQRSPKGTRLYSRADVERLRYIQALTVQLGINVAGVEKVLELELELLQMNQRIEALERRAATLRNQLKQKVDSLHDQFSGEIVRYHQSTTELVPTRIYIQEQSRTYPRKKLN